MTALSGICLKTARMIDLLPNGTLPLMWVFFAFTLVALTQLVFKPTFKVMEARDRNTDLLKKEAAALLEKSRFDLQKYEEALTKTRLKGAAEREGVIKATREEERGLVNVARKENEAALEEIRKSLVKEKEKASADLKAGVAGLARSMVNTILEKGKVAA